MTGLPMPCDPTADPKRVSHQKVHALSYGPAGRLIKQKWETHRRARAASPPQQSEVATKLNRLQQTTRTSVIVVDRAEVADQPLRHGACGLLQLGEKEEVEHAGREGFTPACRLALHRRFVKAKPLHSSTVCSRPQERQLSLSTENARGVYPIARQMSSS